MKSPFTTVMVVSRLIISFIIAGCVAWLPGSPFDPLEGTAASWDYPKHPLLYLVGNPQSKNRPSRVVYIRNLRYHQHPTYTRLVFDLASSVQFSEKTNRADHKATITLKRSVLNRKARAKLHDKRFPQGIDVSEAANKTIQISLNLTQLKKYTLKTLNNPPRLVLDLYYSPNGQGAQHSKPVLTQKSRPVKGMKDRLVVIDPGHGGKDPGAIGPKGTKEKHVTLVIAKLLKDLTEKRLGAKVLLTREQDRFLSLEKRVELANKKKADLFISIHVNSHPQAKIRGLELYHFGKASDPRALEVAARENGTPLGNNAPAWQFILADKLHDQKIDESRDFAWMTRKFLINTLSKHYTVKDHGVKTAPFYVLRYTTMPSILAEVAFVSNPTDEKRLRNTTFQRRMAEGIFRGIKGYLASQLY